MCVKYKRKTVKNIVMFIVNMFRVCTKPKVQKLRWAQAWLMLTQGAKSGEV